jgi:penicillin G amidase
VLETWDGNYDADSLGASALELVFYHLSRQLVTADRREIYAAAWGMRALVGHDVLAADPEIRMKALGRAMHRAARDFGSGSRWGARHRLRLAHPFGAIPLLGRRYRFVDMPASGTSETLMKTSHGLTNRRHSTGYGSVARHISGLGDPDRNHFALLGGQDGWFGSSTFIDQVPLWQRGEYIALPLRAETARATFPHHTSLTP